MSDAPTTESPAQEMVPYTGFYPLNPSADVPAGAFVLVDTSFSAVSIAGIGTSKAYLAQISISTDGKTSTVYTMDDCTFADSVLTITSGGNPVATLTFASASGVTSLSGKIGTTTVSGTTPFAPIHLPLWAGTYYQQTGSIGSGPATVYLYAPKLQIDAENNVSYAIGNDGVFTPVPNYWYDFAMFVVAFQLDGKTMTFEMGTSAGWGRVAGDADGGGMLVSIQQNQPVPNL